MPESEEQKEIRREQSELERSLRDDGPTPIPDDPKPSTDKGIPSAEGEESFEMRDDIKFIADEGKTNRFEDLTDRQLQERQVALLEGLPEALAAILQGDE